MFTDNKLHVGELHVGGKAINIRDQSFLCDVILGVSLRQCVMARRKETLDLHRIIMVGMAGVGKSALTLQYMYDEVSKGPSSPLKLCRLAVDLSPYVGILCSL